MTMFLSAETIDDALRELYPKLLKVQKLVETSRKETKEITGVLVEITKPRARLSRSETRGKPFSCLGELLWYLSRDNNLGFISYYIQKYEDESDDGETVYGGYGPRLFKQRGIDQVANVIDLLRRKPNSRRAVIQLFDAEDIENQHKEIPCTTSLQFLVRDGAVNCMVSMRSNDAYLGFPHDVFCFTMLQEIVARSLGAEVGPYKHFAGSMHLYRKHFEKAETYLNEAVQPRIEMPAMPLGDPWPAIRKLLEAEYMIRFREEVDADSYGLDPYWADLIRLLQVFGAKGNEEEIEQLKSKMAFNKYAAYIYPLKEGKMRNPFEPIQRAFRLITRRD